MAKAKTHKTGKTKLHKGKKINEYSDGCWRYDGGGALAIRSPAWATSNFTKENSGVMQRRGVEALKEKKQQAILRRAKEHLSLEQSARLNMPHDVAAEAAAELYMEVFEHDDVSVGDRVKVYKEVGADVGFVDKRVGGGGTQAVQVNITISDKAKQGIEEEDQILDALWEEL